MLSVTYHGAEFYVNFSPTVRRNYIVTRRGYPRNKRKQSMLTFPRSCPWTVWTRRRITFRPCYGQSASRSAERDPPDNWAPRAVCWPPGRNRWSRRSIPDLYNTHTLRSQKARTRNAWQSPACCMLGLDFFLCVYLSFCLSCVLSC